MKSILQNFGYLFISRIVDFGVPLIILPYLISTVGKNNYGLYAFAFSLIVYLMNIVQFGFSLSAVREVASNRDNKNELNYIFSKVLCVKFILIILCFILLNILLFAVPIFYENKILYYSSFLMVLGDLMFCSWFFQGIEKMKFITFINFISKLSYLVLVVIVIKSPEDYIYIPICQSIGFIFSGGFALYVIFKVEKVKFYFVRYCDIISTFKESFSSFITLIIPTLYSNTSMFLLGIFASPVAVTYFDGATKICRAFTSVNVLLNRVLYPFLSRNNTKKSFRLTEKVYFVIGGVSMIFMFVTAPLATKYILGNDMKESLDLILILSLSPLMLSIRSIYGINFLLVHKYDKLYMEIALIASVVGLLSSFILIPNFTYVGAAIVIILSQTIYALLSYLGYYRMKNEI